MSDCASATRRGPAATVCTGNWWQPGMPVRVAPGLIPRKPGQRVKTDRRDCLSLARLDRAGELTPVWVPDTAQEAMRDLSRAREDMMIFDKQLRQRLAGFLLRHGRRYSGRSPWTQAYWRWLEGERFDSPYQQIVMEEYAEAVRQAQARMAGLEKQLHEAAEDWSLGEAARALTALRGIKLTAAITLLAELDDISRFENPCQLMGYVGLVPSESSSGTKRRQGGLTKAGNPHARRMLFECAWAYRFPARRTYAIQRRAEQASPAVQAISWKAQKRLCGRFRRLTERGADPNEDGDRCRPRAVRIHLGRGVRSPTAWPTSCLGLNRSRKEDGRHKGRRPHRRTLDPSKKRRRATFDDRVRQLHDECL